MSQSRLSVPWGHAPTKDTISLLPRLAALYPDEVIAGILNRQGRQTATGGRFTASLSFAVGGGFPSVGRKILFAFNTSPLKNLWVKTYPLFS
ncbi:MAG: hypothetical protein M3Y27_04230 [Acidobacteriota bacterium]|nr:hypothetical protein [Acidobacteriota bacterium]